MIWQSVFIGAAIACCSIAAITAFFQMTGEKQDGEKTTLVLSFFSAAFIILLLAFRGWHECRIPVSGKLEALSMYALALFLSYAIMATRNSLNGVSTIVLPLITLVMITAAFGVDDLITPPDSSWPAIWLSLHVLTAFIGYGFFTTASILAIIYLIQDNNLKKKHFGCTYEKFPSLENLEDIMRRQIGFAFLIFTTSIILGIIMIYRSSNSPDWITDPKVAATAATWIVYAILLHLRTTAGMHGRNIALATIAGLALILFTFIGVHLIAESTHNFLITQPGN